jgi:hypothetical protein
MVSFSPPADTCQKISGSSSSTEGQHDWAEAIWSERSTVLQYVVLCGLFWLKNRGWAF